MRRIVQVLNGIRSLFDASSAPAAFPLQTAGLPLARPLVNPPNSGAGANSRRPPIGRVVSALVGIAPSEHNPAQPGDDDLCRASLADRLISLIERLRLYPLERAQSVPNGGSHNTR